MAAYARYGDTGGGENRSNVTDTDDEMSDNGFAAMFAAKHPGPRRTQLEPLQQQQQQPQGRHQSSSSSSSSRYNDSKVNPSSQHRDVFVNIHDDDSDREPLQERNRNHPSSSPSPSSRYPRDAPVPGGIQTTPTAKRRPDTTTPSYNNDNQDVINPHRSSGRPDVIPEGNEDASSMQHEPPSPSEHSYAPAPLRDTVPRRSDMYSRDDDDSHAVTNTTSRQLRGPDMTQYAEQHAQECCCCLYNLKCAAVGFNIALFVVFAFTTVVHILYDDNVDTLRWQSAFWKTSVAMSVIAILLLLISIVMILNVSIFSPSTYGLLVFTFGSFCFAGGLNLSRTTLGYDGWVLFSLVLQMLGAFAFVVMLTWLVFEMTHVFAGAGSALGKATGDRNDHMSNKFMEQLERDRDNLQERITEIRIEHQAQLRNKQSEVDRANQEARKVTQQLHEAQVTNEKLSDDLLHSEHHNSTSELLRQRKILGEQTTSLTHQLNQVMKENSRLVLEKSQADRLSEEWEEKWHNVQQEVWNKNREIQEEIQKKIAILQEQEALQTDKEFQEKAYRLTISNLEDKVKDLEDAVNDCPNCKTWQIKYDHSTHAKLLNQKLEEENESIKRRYNKLRKIASVLKKQNGAHNGYLQQGIKRIQRELHDHRLHNAKPIEMADVVEEVLERKQLQHRNSRSSNAGDLLLSGNRSRGQSSNSLAMELDDTKTTQDIFNAL